MSIFIIVASIIIIMASGTDKIVGMYVLVGVIMLIAAFQVYSIASAFLANAPKLFQNATMIAEMHAANVTQAQVTAESLSIIYKYAFIVGGLAIIVLIFSFLLRKNPARLKTYSAMIGLAALAASVINDYVNFMHFPTLDLSIVVFFAAYLFFVMPSINGGRKQKIQQIPPQPPATPQAPAAEESAQKQY